MATIKLCDWTKKRLTDNEPTFKVSITDDEAKTASEFEVGEEGMKQILEQMQSDVSLTQPILRVTAPPSPSRPAPQIVVAHPRQPVEHIPAPNSMPQPPMAQQEEVQGEAPVLAPGEVVAPIEFPESPLRPLPMPSVKQRQQVIEESTKFEEGTLGALSHPKKRKEAAKKLRSLESDTEGNFRRNQGGAGQFKINDNWREY